MRRSIRNNVSMITTVVMTAFVIFGFILTYVCVNRLDYRDQKQLAEASLEFAAITIDADKARECLSTRMPDSEYLDTLEKLKVYRNDNSEWLKRISLVSFNSTNGSYIYDTGGSGLGSKLEFDRYKSSVKAELINGRKTWTSKLNGAYYAFRPVRTLDDVLAGYIIIEMDTGHSKNYFAAIASVYALVMLGGLAFAALLKKYMYSTIFHPIEQITEMAEIFSSSSEREVPADKADFINSDNEDEISDLGRAVGKMFMDINSGEESLSKAIYDANHDGMTQLFNKRCYNSMEGLFRNSSAICIIYFDVNNLKLMNDTLGHERGDMVIKNAADYIRKFIGENDYCFRMGGDEFMMVMTECTYRSIDRVIECVEKDSPYILNRSSDSVKCALSYGYAYSKAPYNYDALMTEAEENMYAKKSELKSLLNMPER